MTVGCQVRGLSPGLMTVLMMPWRHGWLLKDPVFEGYDEGVLIY